MGLTDRECETNIRESFLDFLDEFLTDFVFCVIWYKRVTFLGGCITTDWRDIDHSLSKLDKCSSTVSHVPVRGEPFDGNFKICNVV